MSFASLRVIRIFPALVFEVSLSALILGPLVTVFPWSHYFQIPVFFRYFRNMIGDIHYVLPAFFWIIPMRQSQYSIVDDPRRVEMLHFLDMLRYFSAAPQSDPLFARGCGHQSICDIPNCDRSACRRNPGSHHRLIIIAFLYGVFFFVYRDKILVSKWLAAVCLIAFSILGYFSVGACFTPMLAAYATVVMGLWNCRYDRVIQLLNYSFGVYLYGFPVQQLVSYLFPDYRYIWFNFLLSFPAALALGFISWHGLEERVGKRKKRILAAIHAPLRYAATLIPAPLARRLSPGRE